MNVTLHTDAETKVRNAAPDLAAALKAMVAHFDNGQTQRELTAAKAALAKAGL